MNRRGGGDARTEAPLPEAGRAAPARDQPGGVLPGLSVRAARGQADFAAVLGLRRRVFAEEQGIAAAGITDADDRRSLHALAVLAEGGREVPVATGRLTLGAGAQGEAHIAWVATLVPYRGRGAGAAVMRFLLAAADAGGAPVTLLSAQTHALAFYARLGFVAFGHRFDVGGIEHQLMARAAGRGPSGVDRGSGREA